MQEKLKNYYLIDIVKTLPTSITYLVHKNNDPEDPMILKSYQITDHKDRNTFLEMALPLQYLDHPALVPLLDQGEDEGYPFTVREYFPHGSLQTLLSILEPQRLQIDEALTLLIQISEGLELIHQQHMLHKNICSNNILIDQEGQARLADFHLEYHYDHNSYPYESGDHTFSYMAPECFQSINDEKSDQYALGCLAYELFSGKLPFGEADYATMQIRHTTNNPASLLDIIPELPAQLDQIILKTLEKDSNNRYDTIASFIRALKSIDTHHTIQALSPRTTHTTTLDDKENTLPDATTTEATDPVMQNELITFSPQPNDDHIYTDNSYLQTVQTNVTDNRNDQINAKENISSITPHSIAARTSLAIFNNQNAPGIQNTDVTKTKQPQNIYKQKRIQLTLLLVIGLAALMIIAALFVPLSHSTSPTKQITQRANPTAVTTATSTNTILPVLTPINQSQVTPKSTSPIPTTTPQPILIQPTNQAKATATPIPTPKPQPTATPAPPTIISYEAESSANTLGGNAIVETCSNCSGGKGVDSNRQDGYSLTLNSITKSKSGNYTLTIYYGFSDNGNTRNVHVSINGKELANEIYLPDTGGWNTIKTYQITISLQAGNNTIDFFNNAGYAPLFDRIAI